MNIRFAYLIEKKLLYILKLNKHKDKIIISGSKYL